MIRSANNRSSFRIAAVAAGMAACVPAALAQDASTEQDDGTSSQHDILVTARRRSETQLDAPVSVTVLSAENLEKQGVASQQDLQRVAPGLVVRTLASRNGFNFSIRGQSVDPTSGSQPAVLSYVNEFQTTALGPGSFYDVSSIQVLKGPQGTVFGRNTTGGAVLIATERPTLRNVTGYGKVELGSYGKNLFEGAINLPLGDTLALRIAGNRLRQNGYIKNIVNDRMINSTKIDSIRGSLLFEPSDTFENVTVAEYSKSRSNGDALNLFNVNPLGAIGNPPYPFPLNTTAAQFYTSAIDGVLGAGSYATLLSEISPLAPSCGITCYVDIQKGLGPWRVAIDAPIGNDAKSWYVMNTSTFWVGENNQIKAIFGYAQNEALERFDLDGTPFPFLSNALGNKNRQASAEFQVSGEAAGSNLTYLAGAYLYYEKRSASSFFRVLDLGPTLNANGFPISNTILGSQKTYSESAYVNADYKIPGAERVTLSAGARYSFEQIRAVHEGGFNPAFPIGLRERRNDNKASWLIGARYQPNDDTMVYMTHRGSWRSGGFSPFAQPVPAIGSEGGNEFKPETVKDVELGAKYDGDGLGFRASFQLAGFYQWVNDIQRVIQVNLPGGGFGNVTYNVPGGGKFYGMEAQAMLRPARWLELGGSLAYNKARYGNPDSATIFGTFVVFDSIADLVKLSGIAYAAVSTDLPGDNGSLELRGDVYAQGKQIYTNLLSSNPGAIFPSYSLVNLRLTWSNVAGSNFTLAASVENLTKQKYWAGGIAEGSQVGLNTAVPGRPRMFGVQARYDF